MAHKYDYEPGAPLTAPTVAGKVKDKIPGLSSNNTPNVNPTYDADTGTPQGPAPKSDADHNIGYGASNIPGHAGYDDNMGVIDRVKAAVTPGSEKVDSGGGTGNMPYYHGPPIATYKNVGLVDRIKGAFTPGSHKHDTRPENMEPAQSSGVGSHASYDSNMTFKERIKNAFTPGSHKH